MNYTPQLKNNFIIEINKKLKKGEKIWSSSGKLYEVPLLYALTEAFNKCSYSVATATHGRKNIVSHVLTYKCSGSGTTILNCEIADILLICIGKTNIRYSFIQTKADKNASFTKIFLSVHQWDMLHYLTKINPYNTNIDPHVFSCALTESAATYGNFYFDNNSNTIEMSYFIATLSNPINSLVTKNFIKGSIRKFDIKAIYNHTQNKRGFDEVQAVKSLDDLETYANSMKIGTPVFPIFSKTINTKEKATISKENIASVNLIAQVKNLLMQMDNDKANEMVKKINDLLIGADYHFKDKNESSLICKNVVVIDCNQVDRKNYTQKKID